MAESEETTEEVAQPKSKMMLIIIVLNVVVLGAGGAAFFLGGDSAKSDKAEATNDVMMEFDGAPTIVSFKPFIVNLNDAGGSRYLKVACKVEVPGEKGVEIIEGRKAALRHRVILFLSEKSYGDIAGKGKKAKIQKALIGELNAELRAPLVRNMYFTEFVIQ
jgi:flagellar protein FliL